MNLFLKAKHWQIFLLTYGIMFLGQLILMSYVIVNVGIQEEANPLEIFEFFSYFPLIMLIFMGILFGWQWSVAVGLQEFIPEEIKMKLTRFKVFFIYSVGYMLSFMALFYIMFQGTLVNEMIPESELMVGYFAAIIPFHLLAMFSTFHSLYIVAKTFKTAELQREVHFSDFVGEFFLLWFFPIGIWLIQPKINKLIKGELPIKLY